MKNKSIPSRRSGSIAYAHVHLRPKDQIGLHQQPTWELSYVISGEGIRTIGDTKENFLPGEIILLVPEMEHCWDFNPRKTDASGMIENITLTFYPDLLERISELFPELDFVTDYLQNLESSLKFTQAPTHQMTEILTRMEQETEAERTASLIQILILIASQKDSVVVGNFVTATLDEERMKQVEVFTSCNYKREITLGQIAKHIGMNKAAFCSFFKRMKGMTYVTYLNRYRMDMACYLLKKQELSISEVCYQAGYNDIPYFTRLFKKTHGVNPTEYRKEHLK